MVQWRLPTYLLVFSNTSYFSVGVTIVFIFRLKIVDFLTHPYPEKLKDDLHHLCTAGSTGDVCLYNVLLGKMFAAAAKLVVERCGLAMEDVAVIGSHG